MQTSPEIPEDVKAEMDLDERRAGGVTPPTPRATPEQVPEDVRSDLDREARLGGEPAPGARAEEQPPVAPDAHGDARAA